MLGNKNKRGQENCHDSEGPTDLNMFKVLTEIEREIISPLHYGTTLGTKEFFNEVGKGYAR